MKLSRLCSLLLALLLMLTAIPMVSAEGPEPIWGTSPIQEPYAYVSTGSFSGPEQPFSPDPLVSYRWEDPQADADLEIFLRKPVSAETETPASFTGYETLTTDAVQVAVTGPGTILLDFGAEFAGWLEIDSPDLSGTVTLGVSEYNRPARVNSGPQSPVKTAVPKQHGDTYRLELNSELYEGVRYGFINVTEFDQPFTITGIRLVCQVKPVNYEGSFDSNNEMLNRIWYTAAYDVRVNLKKDYFAAILMDRGDRYSWTGDAYPAQAASLVAFGNFEAVLNNLRYTATRGNGIESYELYWVLSLIDYYEYTGDKDGIRSLLPQAGGRLDHAYAIYGTNPNLGFIGWDERLGGGFEFPNIPENQNIYMLNCIRAWSEFAAVLDDLGETASAAKYRSYAQEKTAALLADENWTEAYGLHAAADAINAGITDSATTAALFEEHFTDRVNRLSYSPFNQYFLLQAMGRAGEHEAAVSAILDMFGGQIAYGGTTFFENYRPQWNEELEKNGAVPNNQAGYTSLAHPWGAGVLTWMSEELLGIKADAAGFEAFTVKPHLTSQLTRISGSTPTGHGIIKAAIDVEAGTGALTVPAGTTATFAVPKAGRTVSNITVNGQPAAITAEDDDFCYLTGLTEGEYAFTMTYTGEAPEAEELEWIYPAKFVREDAVTQGNWVGTYGSEGYVLCGSSPVFGRSLPDYVESVTNYKAKLADWNLSADDVRAPSAGWGDPDTRIAGCWYCANPSACMQTFTVDVNLKEDRPYTVALYFVDWDEKDREVAVEVFDGETLDMVAPVQVVSDYENGKYLVYEYDRSIRFRIDHVYGDNATLSGIFFGEGAPEGPVISANLLDDRDAAVTYAGANWTHDPITGAYQDTFSYTNVTNATATLAFEGTGVTYLASKEANRGIAEVILDGVPQGEIDLYSAAALRQQAVFSVDGLENGEHTLQICVTGRKNAAANGAYVDVDAFEVRRTIQVEAPSHTVTAAETTGGTVFVDKTEAQYGQTVTVTAEPEEGYVLEAITVHQTGDPSVTVEVTDGAFRMPVYDVTVTASFRRVSKAVSLLLTGPAEINAFDAEVTYTLSAENMNRLATLILTVDITGGTLTDPIAEACGDWYIVAQTVKNGQLHVALANNAGVTGTGDLLTVTLKPMEAPGEAALTIVEADLSAYLEAGETFVPVNLDKASVTTAVKHSIYDVNKDGIVDQLDMTRAQRYFGTANTDADVDASGEVDIQDLILILNNYHELFLQ